MTREFKKTARQIGARAGDEAGFTLIELLVAMVVSLIVIGGGTVGMTLAFRSSSETSARTAATNQAEVRFEVLTRDLRQAVSCPPAFYPTSNSAIGLVVNVYPTSLWLQMCDPAPGLAPSAAGSESPQSALVTWTCNPTTESCVRQVQTLSGNTVGPATTTNTITGVVSVSFSGLIRGYNTASPTLTNLATLGVGNFSTSLVYQFNPATFDDQNNWLTWVGITAQIATLQTPDSTTNLRQATGTAPVTFQTSVTLRNSITS